MLKHTDDNTKADLTEFEMYMPDSFSDQVQSTSGLLTIDSKAEFKLSLNDLSRRTCFYPYISCQILRKRGKVNEE